MTKNISDIKNKINQAESEISSLRGIKSEPKNDKKDIYLFDSPEGAVICLSLFQKIDLEINALQEKINKYKRKINKLEMRIN